VGKALRKPSKKGNGIRAKGFVEMTEVEAAVFQRGAQTREGDSLRKRWGQASFSDSLENTVREEKSKEKRLGGKKGNW